MPNTQRKKEVTISFIIPAHNEESGISDCIESIKAELARSPISAEIIVINNASTDTTRSVAKNAGALVIDEPRKGTGYARHTGFTHAHGTFIANIDADTMISKGWLTKVIREFKKNPRLVALSGPYAYYDLPFHARILVYAFYTLAFVVYFTNRHIFGGGSMTFGGNFIARRAALTTIGGYNTAISFYGDDTDTAHRLSKIGKVKFTPFLRAKSSGRRLTHEGIVKVGIRYTMNYFWITFFKKPYTKKSIDVRPKRS
ncbi:MAG: glycosyltransferase family 2 protein [Patescibacteria group bacterium]|nr:glycosyltransferase family 2 protein [Patescibacteria group bacterium]